MNFQGQYKYIDLIKVVSAKQMQTIDMKAIEEYGIPGMLLMENAGLGCVVEINKVMAQKRLYKKKVLIFCGKGNNGGDGFVIARHLFNQNVCCKVFLLAKKSEIKGDALTNLKICQKFGMDIVELEKDQLKMNDFEDCGLVVDAILGTGMAGRVRGLALEVIKKINLSNKFVLSVDIPSGLSADKAQVVGDCIQADITCTMGLPKIAQLLYPAKKYIGRLEILDIGFPKMLLESDDFFINLVTKQRTKKILDEIDTLEFKNILYQTKPHSDYLEKRVAFLEINHLIGKNNNLTVEKIIEDPIAVVCKVAIEKNMIIILKDGLRIVADGTDRGQVYLFHTNCKAEEEYLPFFFDDTLKKMIMALNSIGRDLKEAVLLTVYILDKTRKLMIKDHKNLKAKEMSADLINYIIKAIEC